MLFDIRFFLKREKTFRKVFQVSLSWSGVCASRAGISVRCDLQQTHRTGSWRNRTTCSRAVPEATCRTGWRRSWRGSRTRTLACRSRWCSAGPRWWASTARETGQTRGGPAGCWSIRRRGWSRDRLPPQCAPSYPARASPRVSGGLPHCHSLREGMPRCWCSRSKCRRPLPHRQGECGTHTDFPCWPLGLTCYSPCCCTPSTPHTLLSLLLHTLYTLQENDSSQSEASAKFLLSGPPRQQGSICRLSETPQKRHTPPPLLGRPPNKR